MPLIRTRGIVKIKHDIFCPAPDPAHMGALNMVFKVQFDGPAQTTFKHSHTVQARAGDHRGQPPANGFNFW